MSKFTFFHVFYVLCILTCYHTVPHFNALKISSCGKHCEKRRNVLEQAISPLLTVFLSYMVLIFHFKCFLKCLLQFVSIWTCLKFLLSSNGLKSFNSYISVIICSFFEFGTVSKWCIGEWVNMIPAKAYNNEWFQSSPHRNILDPSIFKCIYRGEFNSSPDDKILDWSKLKAFADNKINVTNELTFVLGKEENIDGKGENAGNQHFLLFPQCFLPSSKQIWSHLFCCL